MELCERYIHEVIRQLPRKQREDVAQELRSALADGLERELAGGADRGEAELALLREWSPPQEQAQSYRSGPDHLIGPRYLPAFLRAVKIGLIIAAALAAIGPVMVLIEGPQDWRHIFVAFNDWWNSLLRGGLMVVGGCTVVLGIAERVGNRDSASDGVSDTPSWDPSKLPAIKDPDRVERGDMIANLIFLTLAALVLNWGPGAIMVPARVNGEQLGLPLLWPAMAPHMTYLRLLVLGGLAMVVTVLLRGRWSLPTRLWSFLLSLLEIGFFVRLRADPELFQPETRWLVGQGWPVMTAESFVDGMAPLLEQVQDKGLWLVIALTVFEAGRKGWRLVRRTRMAG